MPCATWTPDAVSAARWAAGRRAPASGGAGSWQQTPVMSGGSGEIAPGAPEGSLQEDVESWWTDTVRAVQTHCSERLCFNDLAPAGRRERALDLY
ncbi:unnamed protein product [Boreogadus saida]